MTNDIGNQGQGSGSPQAISLDGIEDIVGFGEEPGTPAPTPPPTPDPEADPEGTPPVEPAKPTFGAATDDLLDGGEPKPTGDPEPKPDPKGDGGDEEDNEPDPDASPDEVFYSGVVDILKKKDFFQQDDLGEIKNDTDLATALDKEIEARLSDRYKELDALAKTGAPVDVVVKLQSGLAQLGQIDENVIQESPDIAQQLIVEDFVNKGFSQEDAVKYFGLIDQAGNSTEEAMKALVSRKNQFTKAISDVKTKAIDKKKAEEAIVAKEAADLSKAFEANEILGRTVGPSTREKLKKLVNTPVGYTKEGQPLNELMKFKTDNPVEFEQKLSYLFLVTNGFKDLKSFDRSAETRVSRGMKEAVNVLSTDGGPVARASSSGKNVIDLDSIDDIV